MNNRIACIERALAEIFSRNSSRAFLTRELVSMVYGAASGEKKHHVAVLQAAAKAAEQSGWRRVTARFRGSPIVYYNPLDLRSYVIAALAATINGHYCPEWKQVERDLKYLPDVAAKVQPGGAWWNAVELEKARRALQHELRPSSPHESQAQGHAATFPT